MADLSRDRGSNGIRLLRPARDLGQLADLLENAFGDDLSKGGERVLRELRMLRRLGPLSALLFQVSAEADGMLTGLVWVQDGRVVGNITVTRAAGHSGRWQISNVAVLDAYRGRGIGRKLMEAALDMIVQHGGRAAYLLVRHDNIPALRLYRGLNFAEVDGITDLNLESDPGSVPDTDLRVLRRLRPRDGRRLYELVSKAEGPGRRWLSEVRRGQYVYSGAERFFRAIERGLSAEIERWWGVPNGGTLDAGVSLRARWLWNRQPHRMSLWVAPERRSQIEEGVAQDMVLIASSAPHRPTVVSLPRCEEGAIQALLQHGFREVRTLLLMRLYL